MATARRSEQPEAPTTRRQIDWDAVERDWRLGKFTSRELAEKYRVSHTAINKKARDNAWVQDLTDQIRQATNARLTTELVSSEVANGFQAVSETVLVAAEINTRVILSHRQGLNQIAEVKRQLLRQIGQAAESLPELTDIIEMVRSPDENGNDRVNDALRKAMGRSALVDDLKKLADVDEKVRKGEREAFGIESLDSAPDTLKKTKRLVVEFVDVEPRFDK